MARPAMLTRFMPLSSGIAWNRGETSEKVAQKDCCNVVCSEPLHLAPSLGNHPELRHHRDCVNVEVYGPEDIKGYPIDQVWVEHDCQRHSTHDHTLQVTRIIRLLV